MQLANSYLSLIEERKNLSNCQKKNPYRTSSSFVGKFNECAINLADIYKNFFIEKENWNI